MIPTSQVRTASIAVSRESPGQLFKSAHVYDSIFQKLDTHP
jgi:hypothetical protein